MVFKATFNNISVISWQSVLLVEETVPHTWQLIVKIIFQMQTHELNPVLKSFIFHIQ
jgi:hypothetical protein